MNSYLITYDLIKRKNYPELFEAIKEFNWWHCLGSVWIIKSELNSTQIFNMLLPHIDDDDKLMVIRVMREANCTDNFSEECQNWLQSNL